MFSQNSGHEQHDFAEMFDFDKLWADLEFGMAPPTLSSHAEQQHDVAQDASEGTFSVVNSHIDPEKMQSLKFQSFPASSSEDSAASLSAYCRWSNIEDIFLTGITIECYYRRHSLKISCQERKIAKDSGVPVETVVWGMINDKFLQAKRRHEELTGELLPDRTQCALKKHWSDTSSFSAKGKEDSGYINCEGDVPPTQRLHREWDHKYNRHYLLSCSEERFKSLVAMGHPAVQEYVELVQSLSFNSAASCTNRKRRRLDNVYHK